MNKETSSTYEDAEYWNKLRKSRDYSEQEQCIVVGNDGENEFDQRILEEVNGKKVLDIGCGIGLFTLEIAQRAKTVVGIDFSKEAIVRAIKNNFALENIEFRVADAEDLPFSNCEFEVIVSRRGPVTSSKKAISEAYRVLKTKGLLMEITIGERDKENIAKIFGRGQMFGVKEKVAITKDKMLTDVGFCVIQIKDYLATEIFASLDDLVIRLNSAPIIPNFERGKDQAHLSEVERLCKTSRGIETPEHRVTIIAQK